MTDFLLFCLASVGMTLILVRGSIFQSFRQYLANETARIRRRREKKGLKPVFSLIGCLHELIECVQCSGFWCGMFCGLVFITSDTYWVNLENVGIRYLGNRILMLFCCGAVGSFLAPLGDLSIQWLFCVKELRVRDLETDDFHRTEAAAQQPTEQVGQDDFEG